MLKIVGVIVKANKLQAWIVERRKKNMKSRIMEMMRNVMKRKKTKLVTGHSPNQNHGRACPTGDSNAVLPFHENGDHDHAIQAWRRKEKERHQNQHSTANKQIWKQKKIGQNKVTLTVLLKVHCVSINNANYLRLA